MARITKLADLDFGIYDEAKAATKHGKAYVDLNEYLSREGMVDEDLVRVGKDQPRDKWGRAVSPVRQLLTHSGIRLGGLNAHTCGVFMSDKPEHVKGAETLFPALTQEWFEEGIGLTGGGFYTTPGEPGDTVYPQTVRPGFVDERSSYPAEQVSLEDLVSLTIGIDSDSYKTAVVKNDIRENLEIGRVAEHADLPLYRIETAENTINIYKYGSRLRASYEAVRRMQINKIQIMLQEMAFVERLRLIRQALEVALNGDGNANPAINATPLAGLFDIQELNTWLRSVSYEYARGVNIVVAAFDEGITVENLRFSQTNLQLTPQQLQMYDSTPRMPTGQPLRYAPKNSILEASDKLLAFNTARSLEQVVENGSQINETQRFITNQTQEWTMSINTGFAKPFSDSFFTLEQTPGS